MIIVHDRNYKESLQRVFGNAIPDMIEEPDFGASFLDASVLALNDLGKQTAKNILCILAHDFPNLVYCPFIKAVVNILCHKMSAYDALGATVSLIQQSEQPFNTINTTNYVSTANTHNWNYFPLFRSEIVLFGRVFLELLQRYIPKVTKHLKNKLKVNLTQPAVQNIDDITRYLSSIFISILPIPKVFRVCDSFFCEGYKAIYRYCLGYMIYMQDKLVLSTTWEEFMMILMRYNPTFGKEDLERLYTISYKEINISRNIILSIQTKLRQQYPAENEAPSPVQIFRPLPLIDVKSEIIDENHWLFLWKEVPSRHRLHNLELVFATRNDGYNLGTLYKNCGTREPLMVIIETSDGTSFGAFISESFSKSDEKTFYGNGESFLFSINPNRVYQWVGLNNSEPGCDTCFILARRDQLALGGGKDGHGLWLNSSLTQTSSARSSTYNNAPLVGSEKVKEVARVEVYAFIHQ
jgi:hypothetical protein